MSKREGSNEFCYKTPSGLKRDAEMHERILTKEADSEVSAFTRKRLKLEGWTTTELDLMFPVKAGSTP